MTRWMDSRIQPVFLDTQYRMHDRISEPVSRLFYNNRLLNGRSVYNRPAARVFTDWTRQVCDRSMNPFFVQASGDTSMLNEVDSFSYVNTKHLIVVRKMVRSMVASNIKPADIMLISFYSAHRHQLARMFRMDNITLQSITTVDGSQGDEGPYVILDMVSPGG